MNKKAIKVCTVFLFVIILCTGLFMCAYAENAIKLFINGNEVACDVSPCIINDRTMVPARVVFENFGAAVNWNAAESEVKILSGTTDITFKINSKNAYVNGESVTLDSAPVISNDRTLIPIRFVSEKLGYNVNWNGEKRYVMIESPKTNTPVIHKVETSDEKSYQSITITADTSLTPRVSTAESPYRLILDFDGVKIDGKDVNLNVTSGFVKQLRWAQHGDYARVVAETYTKQPYEIIKSDYGVIIKLGTAQTRYTPSQDNNTSKPDTTAPDSGSNTQKPASDKPSGNLIVAIDAGHGGKDTGALGKDDSGNIVMQEKDVTLNVSKRVENILKSRGISVIMTRNADVYEGETTMENLQKRCDIANNANAAMFVSIHINSFTTAEATGTQVCYTSESTGKYGVTSLDLAKNILTPLVKATGLTNRGTVDSPRLVVLKNTQMPAVLLELAFISNPGDRQVLADSSKLDKISYAIADGIEKSLNTMKNG